MCQLLRHDRQALTLAFALSCAQYYKQPFMLSCSLFLCRSDTKAVAPLNRAHANMELASWPLDCQHQFRPDHHVNSGATIM